MKRTSLLFFLCLISLKSATARVTYNFNTGWTMGDKQNVTLPRAWNENESFVVWSESMSDSIVVYRKSFILPKSAKNQRVIIEFEGVRQMAEVNVNGKKVGLSENGVMAFGFDITNYVKVGKNEIVVKTNNDWNYKEQSTGVSFQWMSRHFYANYGGINKNVKLHIVPQVHQTLPLYSNLGTTGQYIYATAIDIKGHKANIHAETQVKNNTNKSVKVSYQVVLCEYDGTEIVRFDGSNETIGANEIKTLKAEKAVEGLHFWSWGYGYLYKVKTIIGVEDKYSDEVETITGFRKTEFKNGYLRLNDRGIQIHGYAQRSTNEWPGVGQCVPAWLSDYSNNLIVESCGNLVRWMHVTPSKQDIESCDRVGLMQSMPAADAEKDPKGRQWEQRTEVMRDAIIYNRNNPSIIFYECGNCSISEEHMTEMKAIRDKYDPYGGRAIGSREMLNSNVAEYGGEMLNVNKSDTKPMWLMEYCRDEALRFYWNSWCYPYHAEGTGPLYHNDPSVSYNHNQDVFTEEQVRRWYDIWLERPGQGTMVNDGGAKIIFSDTQTHCRGEESYRRSGVVDPMRIEKDAFFANQVMWDCWVDDVKPRTYIVGHWTYDIEEIRTKKELRNDKAKFIVPTVMVVSNSDSVKLFLNGKELSQKAERSANFLFIFKNIIYDHGTLVAIGYDKKGKEQSRYSLVSSEKPQRIILTPLTSPAGWRADGADVALVQVEVVDVKGRRCPVDNSMIHFTLKGNAEWRGGLAKGKENYVLRTSLPVECGINRVMLRSTTKAGKVTLTATAEGLDGATIELHTMEFKQTGGLSEILPSTGLPMVLKRGETPYTPSFTQHFVDVPIESITAGSNMAEAKNVCDKDETTSWQSDGHNNWITLKMAIPEIIDEVTLKMGNGSSKSYPIVIYADSVEVFKGDTKFGRGYTHLKLKPRKASTITIKSQNGDNRKNEKLIDADTKNGKKDAKEPIRLFITELQLKKNIDKK